MKKVVCVNSGTCELIYKGVTYEVLQETEGMYLIIANDGYDHWYLKERFVEMDNNEKATELKFVDLPGRIKDKEIWEGEGENIIGLPDGKFKIEWHEGVKYVIDPSSVYKLKERQQVLFNEAFAYYEAGVEIESCVTGDKYKQAGDGTQYKFVEIYGWCRSNDCNITIKEIQGRWYINE